MSDISNSNLTLTLTVVDVNKLLTILGETSYVKSADLVNKIQAQGNEQVTALLAACEPAPAEAPTETPAEAPAETPAPTETPAA